METTNAELKKQLFTLPLSKRQFVRCTIGIYGTTFGITFQAGEIIIRTTSPSLIEGKYIVVRLAECDYPVAIGQWSKLGAITQREKLVLSFPKRKYDYGKQEYYLEILDELPSITIKGKTYRSEPSVNHLGYIELHSYSRGQLRLILEPFQYKALNRYFHIEVISSGAELGIMDEYETSLEEVWKGFCILADKYNDWDSFEELSKDAKTARALMLIEHYKKYFGAYWDYSIFGRKFMSAVSQVIEASNQMSRN